MSFGIWIVSGKGQEKGETVERIVYRSGSSEESHVKSAMEAQNVRVKLSAAEERVKSLVSKLDAVSEDASRARLEIHSTLLEAWNIVDLLGKDRCGDAVLEVRKKQQSAEERASSLEVDIKKFREDASVFESQASKLKIELEGFRTSFDLERKKREEYEVELEGVKARLKHALSVTDHSESFSAVQTQMKQLAAKFEDRKELLLQILGYVKSDLELAESFDPILSDIKNMLIEHEESYSSTIASIKLDPSQLAGALQKQKLLEQQLREAHLDREQALKNLELMQDHVRSIKVKPLRTVDSGGSMLGTLSLMFVSLLFGMFLVFVFRIYGGVDSVFKSEAQPLDEGLGSPVGSAVTGNAGSTPHPRGSLARSTPRSRGPSSAGSTPASGFYHSDRSPMTYVRSAGSPSYRD
ncbi:hypothetical protein NDN08_004476 [Rhodosorus marinus]|uniref:Cilia- and flagella-associated protein 157 n=1 Tax=Rhodosorus marinus TaxID=101924 RepID=A0AAV8UQK8_9RHOD|nr:hypothetical protein NDN08_004476 [Rhodosorus marinus]